MVLSKLRRPVYAGLLFLSGLQMSPDFALHAQTLSFIIDPHANILPANELLDGTLPEYDAKTLLTSLGFRDWQAALRNLKHIAARDAGARPLLESILPHLFTTSPKAPTLTSH